MKTINIHIEGPGELRFMSLLVEHHFGLPFSKRGKGIDMFCESVEKNLKINLHSYDTNKDKKQGGISSQAIRKLLKYIKATSIPKKEHNILIIDADTEKHRQPLGGYVQRKKYLEGLKTEFGVDFDFFIIPDNNNSGNLEDLLDKIISPKGQPFYECLKNYTYCISKLEEEYYPVDVIGEDMKKIRFDWYPFMMLGRDYRKQTTLSKRDYTNDLWDLDSESLTPLLNFLKDCLES